MPFEAPNDGNYSICVTNGPNAQTIDFKMNLDIGAVDIEDIIKKKHLMPVEILAEKISDQIEKIKGEYDKAATIEARNNGRIDGI